MDMRGRPDDVCGPCMTASGAKRTFEKAVRSKSANNTPMLIIRLASLRDDRDGREVVYAKNLP
jgi:hypothetical protein